MSEKQKDSKKQSENQPEGITEITVSGFKSISKEQTIAIRPLTVLAGANSSGKSSIMQPLLLLKQTLESPYDPGVLRLNGPNVQFTKADQALSLIMDGNNSLFDSFKIKLKVYWEQVLYSSNLSIDLTYKMLANKGFDIENMIYILGDDKFNLRKNMTHNEILSNSPEYLSEIQIQNFKSIKDGKEYKTEYKIYRNKCFLSLSQVSEQDKNKVLIIRDVRFLSPESAFSHWIFDIIHISGLMNRRKRTFPVSAVGESFPGLFEDYFASVIRFWEEEKDQANLDKLKEWLIKLSFTRHIETKYLNDTEIELMVDRLPPGSDSKERDLVSVADVGVGVSQTLPILVALLVARPGQLVYIEQPELHLHPKAQHKLSEILSEAANRDVRVVIETHSDLLLLGIQTQVAEKEIDPELVKVHWFTRKDKGATGIISSKIEKDGAFEKQWPDDFDFGSIYLDAESRFLDAAESHHIRKNVS